MEKTGLIVTLVLVFILYIYPAIGMFKYRKEPWPRQHKFLWVLVGIGLFQLLVVLSVVVIMALCGHNFHWAFPFGIIMVSLAVMCISYARFYIVGEIYRVKERLKEYEESNQESVAVDEQSEESLENDGYRLKVYPESFFERFKKPST